MNLAINNSTNQELKAQRSDSDTAQNHSNTVEHDDHDLELSRSVGEQLGAESLEDTKPENQEDKAVQALTSVANLGRKIGSKALNLSGFIGITVSALSYIFFRFKLLSAAIAAPALGAFYIANTLKNAAKKSQKESGFISDPATIIAKAKDDSTYLEEDFKKVVAAMVKIGEMKDADPKKQTALFDLRKVAKKVSAKRTELKKINQSSNQLQLQKIKNFMDIYDSVKIGQDQSEIDFEDQNMN